MMEIYIIPAIATIISIGTFLMQINTSRTKATSDYANQLEKRIEDLEKRMLECENARVDLVRKNDMLHEDNLNLLKKIVEKVVTDKTTI